MYKIILKNIFFIQNNIKYLLSTYNNFDKLESK